MVRKRPCCPTRLGGDVGRRARGRAALRAAWSGLGGSGPCGLVGSSSDGGSGAGAPGTTGGDTAATFSTAASAACSTVLRTASVTALIVLFVLMGPPPWLVDVAYPPAGSVSLLAEGRAEESVAVKVCPSGWPSPAQRVHHLVVRHARSEHRQGTPWVG